MPSSGRQRLKNTNSGVSMKPKGRMGEKFQDLCASSKEPLQPLNRVDFSFNKDSSGSITSGNSPRALKPQHQGPAHGVFKELFPSQGRDHPSVPRVPRSLTVIPKAQ